ncbi:glycosyl hydrolase [Cystobacter fuscus]|uniref:glycoside hydrolase family 44 protein n=1 Tax=Cystobacter fuscus TaxID=43 RepID=UPI002B2C1E2B|nr:glycosyl hydrolase [Cystobacter fuscus]
MRPVFSSWRGRWSRVALLSGVCLGTPLLASCKRGASSQEASASSSVYDIPAITEALWSQGYLMEGWVDEGWSERELKPPGPARLRMDKMGGWMLRKKGLQGEFGGLALRYRAPADFGDFLEVRLETEGETIFPRVKVNASHVARRDGDQVQLFIPLEQLNPKQAEFSSVVLRAYKNVGTDWVEIDELGLTAPGGMTPASGTASPSPEFQASAAASGAVVEPMDLAYDNGLLPGWEDRGWAEHELEGASPAKLRLHKLGGWILSKRELGTDYGGLTLRYRAPKSFGDFLEVRLDSEGATLFHRVRVSDAHVVARDGDWTQVFIPMSELNPRKEAFTQLVLRAYKPVGEDWVEISQLGLARLADRASPPPPSRPPPAVAQAASPPRPPPSRPAPPPTPAPTPAGTGGGARPGFGNAKGSRVVVDCTAPGHSISPLIYGIAFSNLRELKDSNQWELGATARRWGGNASSRYNWKLGNVWNTANDWFFRNVVLGTRPDYTADSFLQANLQHGLQSALTVPLIGWVAKDATSTSFPRSLFGPQQKMDPDVPEAGNGLTSSGEALPPPEPTQTSVEAPPSFIHEWVRSLREKDKKRGRSVQMYILDNEPMLWNTTHRDVHPEPVTYDELLERTIAYGTAVRKADPDAVIAGPAEWGWTNYFHSAADLAPGGGKKDIKAHGNLPLLPWYLKKLREHEQQTGTRILDVVDVHFYPQGKGMGMDERGATDPDTAARRIRSVRALWDPSYEDESWIEEPVELIPRLKRWIAEYYPKRGISIGEYNFGATTHMSGGLAQAEALGRFAEQGITSAFMFTYPPRNSPAFWAFRAFRNFDGQGGRFLDHYVPSRFDKPGDARTTSLFASRDDSGEHMVSVALNLDADAARTTQVEFKGCGNVESVRVFGYRGGPAGFSENQTFLTSGNSVQLVLPPWSMSVLDLKLAR